MCTCALKIPLKRKSKSSKSGEGESSSAPSFDRRWFWDATAVATYMKFLEKKYAAGKKNGS